MNKGWLLGIESLAVLLLFVIPPLSLAFFALRWLLVKDRGTVLTWPLALVPLLILAGHQALAGEQALWLVGLLGLLLLSGSILLSQRRAVVLGGLAALTMLVIGLSLENMVARGTSHALQEQVVTAKRLKALFSGVEILDGRKGHRSFNRFWKISGDTAHVRIELEAKRLQGQPGSQWYLYDPNFTTDYRSEEGISYTRVFPPDEGRPYITRRVNTGSPIAGRTFRARLELRAPTTISTRQCDGILLREVRGEWHRSCLPITLNENWQAFEHIWVPPDEAKSEIIRLELLRIETEWYDVRNVTLEEYSGGQWVQLEPLEPTGVWVRLALPSVEQLYWPSEGFVPTAEWQTHAFEFTDQDLSGIRSLRTVFGIEDSLSVAIRNVTLAWTGGKAAIPLPSPERQQLWFGHQNLAGHTVAVAGLVLLAVARSSALTILAAALVLTAIYFTGSRAALLAALIGLPWLSWLACRVPQRPWALIATSTLVIAGLLTVGPEGLGRLQVWHADQANTVTRPEIWHTAWNAMQRHPWTGAGTEGVAAMWVDKHPDDQRTVPTHAHNFWLQFGAAYGIVGLVAAVWFTVGLVYIAWRRARWRGIGVLLPVFAMNTFDYTLFFPSVLLPLVLALNVLGSGADGSKSTYPSKSKGHGTCPSSHSKVESLGH